MSDCVMLCYQVLIPVTSTNSKPLNLPIGENMSDGVMLCCQVLIPVTSTNGKPLNLPIGENMSDGVMLCCQVLISGHADLVDFLLNGLKSL
jgi:hypothetical protein